MIKEQTILIDNTKLKYYLYRKTKSHRPLIVLIHGLGSNHSRWEEFVETSSLLEHWNILVPDMRGCGNSLVRGKITLETWSHDLEKILEHQNYTQAIFIGHSLGAHIVLFLLARTPKLVRGTVLMDPLSRTTFTPAFRRLWCMRWLGQALTYLVMFLNKLGIKRRHIPFQDLRALDNIARQLIKNGKEKEMIQRYSSPLLDLKFNPVANYFQYTYEILRPLPTIKHSNTPTLLLLSGKSNLHKGRSLHPLTAHFSCRTIKTVDCNHWLLTEKPIEAREIIEDWLTAKFIA